MLVKNHGECPITAMNKAKLYLKSTNHRINRREKVLEATAIICFVWGITGKMIGAIFCDLAF